MKIANQHHWSISHTCEYWYGWIDRDGSVTLENGYETLSEVESVISEAKWPSREHCNKNKVLMGISRSAIIVKTMDPDQWESETNHGRIMDRSLVKIIRSKSDLT